MCGTMELCCLGFVSCVCGCPVRLFAGLWCSSGMGMSYAAQSTRGLSVGKFLRPAAAPAPSPPSRVPRRMLSDPGLVLERGCFVWVGGVVCVCVLVCLVCWLLFVVVVVLVLLSEALHFLAAPPWRKGFAA